MLGGVALLAFLLPLFFLPFFTDYFELPKQVLLFSGILLVILFWLIKLMVVGKFSWQQTPLDIPLAIFIALNLFSIFFSQSKLASAITLSSWLPIIAGLLFYVVTNNFLPNNYSLIKGAFISSATLLSLFMFIRYLGFGIKPAPVSPTTTTGFYTELLQRGFNTFGDLTLTSGFFLIALVATFFSLNKLIKEKRGLKENLLISLLIFSMVSVTVTLILTSPLTSPLIYKYSRVDYPRPVRLPPSYSWEIALEAVKRYPFFGLGPSLYPEAFTIFKPATFNLTKFWNLRFNASYNLWFDALTLRGIVGFFALLYIIFMSLSVVFKNKRQFSPEYLTILFLSLFLPFNSLLWFLFFIFLANSFLSQKSYQNTTEIYQKSPLPALLGGFYFLAIAIIFYLFGRLLLADYYFRQANLAFNKNQGKKAYDFNLKAINLNPYTAEYHLGFSQINFSLANALASKNELSDQEKQAITQLVQQAIFEARKAVELKPASSLFWEHLATLYRNLINFAQGADLWALSSYQQAILRNPADPRLRIDFGGFFYQLNNFDEAQYQFQIATNLKPDYANAFYNLAATYKQKNDLKKALDALERTQQLVDKGSFDYQKVSKEIEELKNQLPKEETKEKEEIKEKETLSLPSPVPTPRIEITPIVLPKPTEATETGKEEPTEEPTPNL